MSEKLNLLKELLGEVEDLNSAAGVLSWDQNTYMPKGGSEARGQQLATLARLPTRRLSPKWELFRSLKRVWGGGETDAPP
jgi:carboxypeptidase Taq